ncbi:NAD(P)H-quinone oxidoreductase subunit U chloroplastic, partial [Bienertia sinuspersici]
MAMSSAKACIPHRALMPSFLVKPTYIVNVPLSCFKYNNYPNNIIDVTLSTRKQASSRFLARSTEDESSQTTTTTTTAEEEEESAVEVPTGPPSLISALNVEKILRGIAITDVDHYARLGLRRGCSYDQVGAAYQNKVKELSNKGLDEEEFSKELDLLKESYNILSSEEERRLYDWSLARNAAPDTYMWPFESDITQTPRGGTPPAQ